MNLWSSFRLLSACGCLDFLFRWVLCEYIQVAVSLLCYIYISPANHQINRIRPVRTSQVVASIATSWTEYGMLPIVELLAKSLLHVPYYCRILTPGQAGVDCQSYMIQRRE